MEINDETDGIVWGPTQEGGFRMGGIVPHRYNLPRKGLPCAVNRAAQMALSGHAREALPDSVLPALSAEPAHLLFESRLAANRL